MDERGRIMKIECGKMYKNQTNPVGNTSIKIEDCFVVTGVKVMQGQKGLFVVMPSRKTNETDENGRTVYKDVCFPVTKEARDQITEVVLKAYNSAEQKQESTEGFVSVDEDFDMESDCPF